MSHRSVEVVRIGHCRARHGAECNRVLAETKLNRTYAGTTARAFPPHSKRFARSRRFSHQSGSGIRSFCRLFESKPTRLPPDTSARPRGRRKESGRRSSGSFNRWQYRKWDRAVSFLKSIALQAYVLPAFTRRLTLAHALSLIGAENRKERLKIRTCE